MSTYDVADLLTKVVSGEYDLEQLGYIRDMLMVGIDITALM